MTQNDEKQWWTIPELASEHNEHPNIVRQWREKLNLGTKFGSVFLLNARECDQLRWVFNLTRSQRMDLVRHYSKFAERHPEEWAKRPERIRFRFDGESTA